MRSAQENTAVDAGPAQRRIPSQRRSRERVERILSVATDLIARKGSDALYMSEVAEGAGISIGSLYQYFPDKSAVIRTLAERYNLYCLDCVRKELSLVRKDTELVTALGRVVDGYYEMFLAEPVMRDIAVAMQSDRALQAIDAADILAHAGLLETVIARLYPHCPPERRETIALLVNQLIATTVRLAISFEQARGETLIAAFKELTLRRLPDMLGQTG